MKKETWFRTVLEPFFKKWFQFQSRNHSLAPSGSGTGTGTEGMVPKLEPVPQNFKKWFRNRNRFQLSKLFWFRNRNRFHLSFFFGSWNRNRNWNRQKNGSFWFHGSGSSSGSLIYTSIFYSSNSCRPNSKF